MKIKTYKQAFEYVLGIPIDEKIQTCIKRLEEEGYKEYNIAYAIWKSQEKLTMYKNDSRFCSILQNEVRKNTYTQQQWNEYWKEKNKINAKGK